MNNDEKKNIMKNPAFQAILSSLICIVVGLIIGFIVLLCINPSGALEGILDLMKNFFNYGDSRIVLKYFGSTLVKAAPLLMCSLSILFCYKVGLFNIGAAGQYGLGAGLAIYAALAWNMPWWVCMLLGAVGGALLATVSGLLKAYCNVNEVISGIMLNWICLYGVNILLTGVKESTSPYTLGIQNNNASAVIPSLGLDKLFNNNQYVTIAIPLAIIIAIVIWVLLEKTKLGYELKATGNNKNAAKYCGMAEKKNIVLTLAIGGALAGLGAAMFYLTGYEQWNCSSSSVPAMGFSGISAAFLGGLNPIGSIFSSFFIQHITMGGAYLDKTMYSAQISDLISAIIIYLCGFVLFFKYMMNKQIAKKEEKTALHAAAAAENTNAANEEGGEKQ